MTETETMQRAKMYIDKPAKGINPFSCTRGRHKGTVLLCWNYPLVLCFKNLKTA